MTSPRPELDALAAAKIDEQDAAALARVATLYDTLDPVPSGLIGRITFGITLDALHAEIAELQRGGVLAGARSDDAATSAENVTFTSATLTTMITITPTGSDAVRIDGWAAPGAGVEVELRTTGGSVHTVADDEGRFVFDEVARGLAQFVLRHPGSGDQPPVVTPSIDL